MKKRLLIAHIGLMSTAVAMAAGQSPPGTALVLKPTATDSPLGYIPPIITKEMVAQGHTSPTSVIKRAPPGLRLDKKPRIIRGNLNPAHVPQMVTSRMATVAFA